MVDVPLAEVLDSMTEHAARLRALLEQFEQAALEVRPANGDWSAVENVRHAFYAEQHHLGRYVDGGLGLSLMGWPQGPRTPAAFANVRPDISAVFEEWERVHAEVCARLNLAKPGLEVQLPRLLQHQVAHGRLACRALSEATGGVVRMPAAR